MNKEEYPQVSSVGGRIIRGYGDGQNGVYLSESGLSYLSRSLVSRFLKSLSAGRDKGVSIKPVCAYPANYQIKSGSLDLTVSVYCHHPEG